MTYLVAGIYLSSDFPFSRLVPVGGDASGLLEAYRKLDFTCADAPPALWRPSTSRLLSVSPRILDGGSPFVCIYRSGEHILSHFPSIADFYLVGPDVVCVPGSPVAESVIEDAFLSVVFPLYLELQERIVLHASVIEWQGRSVAFLAHSGRGKSTLAAACVQVGASLVSDDRLALDLRDALYWAYPVSPRIGFWPDQARYFLGDTYRDASPLGHAKRTITIGSDGWGTFRDSPVPLHSLYRVDRQPVSGRAGPVISIAPLPERDALVELLRFSFLARLVERVGLSRQRLDFLSHLAAHVPVKRLVYPGDFAYLPAIVHAILKDMG